MSLDKHYYLVTLRFVGGAAAEFISRCYEVYSTSAGAAVDVAIDHGIEEMEASKHPYLLNSVEVIKGRSQIRKLKDRQ